MIYKYVNGHWVRDRKREVLWRIIVYAGIFLLFLIGTAIGPGTLGYLVYD
jgi:hypothetical protein